MAPANTIKAAFVYNFAKFVNWSEVVFPNSPDSLKVCSLSADLGPDAFGDMPATIIQGRKIEIVAEQALLGSHNVQTCHVLYLGSKDRDKSRETITMLRGKPVLVVSEEGHGGMIEFVVVKDKVRFTVDLTQVRNSKLNISSQILKLALSVNGEM